MSLFCSTWNSRDLPGPRLRSFSDLGDTLAPQPVLTESPGHVPTEADVAADPATAAQRRITSRIVERAADPSAVTPHALVGAGVQFNDEWGRAHDYAAIVAVIPSNNVVGDLVLLQYFERRRGEPSTQRLIPLVELSGSDRWVLYKSVAEMIWAYAQEEGRKAETLARLNGTLSPEKSGEDDRLETPLGELLGGLLPSGVRQ